MKRFEIDNPSNEDTQFLQMLEGQLEFELMSHYRRNFPDQHLGITFDYKYILKSMLSNPDITFCGIHRSCLSGEHTLPSDRQKPLAITCFMFENDEHTRFHIGLIGSEASDLEALMSEISDWFMENKGTQLVWNSNTHSTINWAVETKSADNDHGYYGIW